MESVQKKPCPFCAEDIKADAKKCKHCGSMLDDTPVVIEKTSKARKQHMLNGLMISGLGILGAILFSSAIPQIAGVWGLMIIGGIIYFIIAKIQAWWHHG